MKVVLIYLILILNVLLISCKLNGEGQICGRPFGADVAEEKIVAGFDVGYYKYPWFTALMISNIVACGGTLVGSKTIITAAHCYKEYIVGNSAKNVKLEDVYNVTLGVYNKCEKEKTQKVFGVEKVYVHEKYKENIPYYDIALLKLKESTSSYQPLCLPKGPIKTRPREGAVPGLGTLRYQGATPCTLHEARLLIYSDLECRKMMNRTGNDPSKVFRVFCAGYMQGGIDTCQGDSGGPFQVTDDYGNYILLGIVSFGFHCANPNLLGVYTDVSQYIDWIEEKSGFNATMEGSNSNSTGTAPNETETTTSKHESTKNPHKVHVVQTFGRPINIIILRSNSKNVEKTPVAKKRVIYPKRKSKNTENKKNPKTG